MKVEAEVRNSGSAIEIDSSSATEPLVSIVIPCFNAEAFVQDAVRSALNQTYQHSEIIAVDDGSTDGTLAALRQFGSRIRILSGRNRGGAAARNWGLSVAKGTFVQFLDADDILLPDKIAVCMSAVRGREVKSIPVTEWRYIGKGSNPSRESCRFPPDNRETLWAMLVHPLIIEAPLHYKSVLDSLGGFREHLACCQEKDLHLRLVARGYHVHTVSVVGSLVRRVPGSVSSSNLKVLLQRREIYANLRRLMEESEFEGNWRHSLAVALVRDAFDLCNAGHYKPSRENIALAVQLDGSRVWRKAIKAPVPKGMVYALGLRGGAFLYSAVKKLSLHLKICSVAGNR